MKKPSKTMKTIQVLVLAAFVSSVSFSSVLAQSAGLSGSLESSRNQTFAKDPSKALMLAFFPGILIHGYGHFYAKDDIWGTSLLTGEILSLTTIGIGMALNKKSDVLDDTALSKNRKNKSRNMVLYGSAFFIVTWLADLFHAPTAVKEYNEKHNLEPAMSMSTDGTPELHLAYRF